ncbi:exosortase [Cognaticolwellia beringensis]|uniref:Exosortase n=2 Tax=Cognaticolwellia beringensis TaxID=1967665 RepID=A0A222G7X8_9GAMM|nr:exosortase [Cognaticolwellia beringensis]
MEVYHYNQLFIYSPDNYKLRRMIKLNKLIEIFSTFFKAPLLGILLISFTVSLLNMPILVTLWRHSFDDGTYSHAYLIPIISLYLFYILQKAGKLNFREKLSFPATVIFICSCLALFITSNAQISLGYWCSLLAVLVTSINMLYKLNRYIVFPSIFLIFIMPVWGMLTNILQEISVSVVTYFMSFTGVPTYVEGNFVTIPAGVFEIADGCSGLRYMIVSLAISTLFRFLYIKNAKKAFVFFALAIFGALLTNWIRITALILIGDYTNMESSLMEDHNTFGWYLFVPFMFILFWWGNKCADIDLTAPDSDSLPESTEHINTSQVESYTNKRALAVLLVLLALSSTTVSTMLILAPDDSNLTSDDAFEIKPQIHFYAFVTRKLTSKDSGIVELTYFFNGKELDGKPSYYENDLIPNGWQSINEDVDQNQKTHIVFKAGKAAVIVASYEINQQQFGSLRAFKIARLTMAAKNINQTKLHWKFIPCQQRQCKAELQNLEGNIIN